MFAFSQVRPKFTGQMSTVDVPLGEYLLNSFEQGIHDSMFNSIMDLTELDLEREGKVISAKEANERYGLPTLEFNHQVYESEARLLKERKEAELRRSFYIEMGAPDGLFSKRGLMGLGAGMVGSMLNPLDFSVNFLPIVGSEAAASRLAQRGYGSMRQSFVRGFVTTEEALARSVPVPRLVSSLIQGSAGSFVAEVPKLVSALESKENYSALDSVVNVLGGAVLGGALHLGMSAAARVYDRLTPGTKEAMLRKAVDQFVRGEDVRVENYVKIDENAIREKVKFDEQVARQKFLETLDVEEVRKAVREKYGETVTQAAFRNEETGEIKSADAHFLIQFDDWEGVAVERGFVTDKGRFVSEDEGAQLMGVKGKFVSEQLANVSDPAWLVGVDRENFDLLKEAGATDAEALNEVRRLNRQRQEERFLSDPATQQRIQEETEARAKEFVESERAKYDEEGQFKREVSEEVRRQLVEGKTMSPEQLQKWDHTEKDTNEVTADVKEQNQVLMKELEEELETLSPEEKKSMESVESKVKSETNAIEQAIDCLLKNPS